MSDDSERFRWLLQKIREGSEEAADELTKEYGSHLKRAVRGRLPGALRPKFDTVDIEQQVWKSFFAEAKSLPDWQDPPQLIRYLAGMAEHKILDEDRHLKTQKHDLNREVRLDESAEIAGPHPISRDPTPSAVAVFNEQYDRLIRNQSPQVREILEMRLVGLTYGEIGDRLGMHERNVRKLLAGYMDREGGAGAESKGAE